MNKFGFQKKSKGNFFVRWGRAIEPLYIFLLFVLFAAVHTLAFGRQMLRGGIAPHDALGRLATYVSSVDHETSEFFYHSREVLDAVTEKTVLFPDERDHMDALVDGIQNLSNAFVHIQEKTGLPTDIVAGFATYKQDMYSLLGEHGPQTYLIILQNTAEKRPNGGFFGSFGVVTIDKGVIERFEILDSYLPGFDKPGTYVTGPEWLLNFLPEREIYFVGANKIGFTYHDGAYIQALYEKSYPGQRVRGVVFVSTDLFLETMPGFREQMREWQFINASVDLIKGKNTRGKKEFYVNSATDYFKENNNLLTKQLLKHLGTIIDKRYINMYLTDISGPMHTWLRASDLTTRFEEDHMYFWDSNISFSKVDSFAQKIIQFRNASDVVVKETMEDIVSIDDLSPGTYTITIIYNLHVPAYYVDYMQSLEEKYGITLTEREIHILAIQPKRATRGVVYMPDSVDVLRVAGDHYHQAEFSTPFSKNVYYKAKMVQNNTVTEVVMEVEIE